MYTIQCIITTKKYGIHNKSNSWNNRIIQKDKSPVKTMAEEVAKLVLPEGFNVDNIGKTDPKMFHQTSDIAHRFGVIKEEANVDEAFPNEIFDMATSEK